MVDEALVHGSAGRRAGAQALAFLNLAGAAVFAFVGFLANGLRCDDNCSIEPGWRNDPNAWQWGATFALTLIILGAALLLNVALRMPRKPQLRWTPVLIQIGALALLTFLSLTAVPGRHGGWGELVWIFAFFAVTSAGAAAASRVRGPALADTL